MFHVLIFRRFTKGVIHLHSVIALICSFGSHTRTLPARRGADSDACGEIHAVPPMPYLAKWFALGHIGRSQAGAEIPYSGGSRREDYSMWRRTQ